MGIPTLSLQGDKGRAAQWLPWAEQQLARYKAFSSTVNQVFKPVRCIKVHVKSVSAVDYIAIHACIPGGGCKFSEVDVCPTGCSEFEIQCEVFGSDANLLELRFLPKTPNTDDWSTYTWDFGDGSPPVVRLLKTGIIHEYDEPGRYDVSLTVERPAEIQPFTISGNTKETKFVSGIVSQADTFATFVATAFGVPGSGQFPRFIVEGSNNFGDPTWAFTGIKGNHTIDLTQLDPDVVTKVELTAVANYWGTPSDTYMVGNLGSVTTFGGAADIVVKTDVTSRIGTIFTITYRDSGSYETALPDIPGAPGERAGWRSGSSVPGMAMTTIPTRKRTTTTIQVNKGFPKETKQIGESVHEIL